MAQAKLVLMSAILTVLVWVSADQMLTESATLPVMIEPTAQPGADVILTLPGARPPRFQVAVTGPQKIIARFRESGPLSLSLPLRAQGTGRLTVNVRDALRENPSLLSGLTVTTVTPAFLEVIADRQITVSLPVWVDKGALDYEVDPSVEPNEVQVTISQRRLEAIPQERRRLVLRADVLLRNKPRGQLLSFPVPLEAKVEGVEARVSPAQVTLRATIKEHGVTDTIAAVPIRFAGSVDLLNEFAVELRDPVPILTQAITVRGPADLVARLVAGDLKVMGLVSLSRGDVLGTGGYQSRKPVFVGLSPGVELANPDNVESIEFRLVRKATPAP